MKPEIAACNAGSLNYLKIKAGAMGLAADGVRQPGAQGAAVPRRDGECGVHPEFECFDVGIVRSVGMYVEAGMLTPAMGRPEVNFVMGVASGMPCDADLLALLPRWLKPGSVWQTR